MKRIFKTVILTMFPIICIGQPGTMTVNVISSLDELGVPEASVVILKRDSVVTSTTTDFEGQFLLDGLEPGMYEVSVSAVGHTPVKNCEVMIADELEVSLDVVLEAIELDQVEEIEWKYFTIIDSTGNIRCVKKE